MPGCCRDAAGDRWTASEAILDEEVSAQSRLNVSELRGLIVDNSEWSDGRQSPSGAAHCLGNPPRHLPDQAQQLETAAGQFPVAESEV